MNILQLLIWNEHFRNISIEKINHKLRSEQNYSSSRKLWFQGGIERFAGCAVIVPRLFYISQLPHRAKVGGRKTEQILSSLHMVVCLISLAANGEYKKRK